MTLTLSEGYSPVSCTRNELGSRPVCLDLNAIGYLGSAPIRDTFRQFNTDELTSIGISTNVMPERAGFICMSVISLEERLSSVP